MGDLNAKFGTMEDTNYGIGKFGLEREKKVGYNTLAKFCHANNLVIANTLFDHQKKNLYTLISPGDRC